MPRKLRRRPRRDKNQWTAIFKQFESSGLSSREFCRREGLALSSFQRWRRRLGSVVSAEFVELVPTQPCPSSSGWSLEVALPNGVCLRFQE